MVQPVGAVQRLLGPAPGRRMARARARPGPGRWPGGLRQRGRRRSRCRASGAAAAARVRAAGAGGKPRAGAEGGEAAVGHDRRLLVFDRRGGLGARGARISSRSGQPILGARRSAVVDGGLIGRCRDGVRIILATGSAAGGTPKTFSICLRFTIRTRRRRPVTARTTRTR
jgi:hypothetical protein